MAEILTSTDQWLERIYNVLTAGGIIYPNKLIPFGDGITPGGVTNPGVSVEVVNSLYAYGDLALDAQTGTNDVIGVGYSAAAGQAGTHIIAIGNSAAVNQSGGSDVIAIGQAAGNSQSGSEVIAIGHGTGAIQSGNNVILLGQSAGMGNALSNMFIIANTELPSYLDFAAATLAIAPTGIAGNTYLYHDQTTNSIGAVRL